MLDVKLRGVWERVVEPVGRGLGAAGLTPNGITAVSLAIQVAVAVLIVRGSLLLAGIVGVIAVVADALDGAVARARGMATSFGALLDSTVDRLVDALFLLPLAWLYGVDPDIARRDEPWVAAMTLVALVASFLVSYVKARAESLGFDCRVGIAERAERVIVILLGLLLDLIPVAVTALAVLSAVTLAQRIFHVRAQTTGA